MKDKIQRKPRKNVLHKGDERQNTKETKENVFHKGDERQNASETKEKCPS
ncbi:hypothetical protein [Bacillus sp. FJAT-49736]|nr:hypothetical protein [Bacillus sp. FJAT-49736]MBS4173836.1 hypothetical protein [Bacillus sp. FJAT-49736]